MALSRVAKRPPALIEAIADRLAPKWAAAFRQAIAEVKGYISLSDLAGALSRGEDVTAILDELPRFLRPASTIIETVITEAEALSLQGFRPKLTVKPGAFTLVNELAVEWARKRSASLVRAIGVTQRDTIRQLVAQATQQGGHPYETAKLIKETIGLDPRLAGAVRNYQRGLAEQGMPADEIARKVSAYTDRLLRYRARMIARTETLSAANRGQQLAWWNAVQNGWLDPNQWNRIWLAGPEKNIPIKGVKRGSPKKFRRVPCAVCEAMDRQTVALFEPWTLPSGRVIETPTDSHPHCRCTEALQEVRRVARSA